MSCHDFELTYSKENINPDGSLFQITLCLEAEHGHIRFIVAKNIEYSISDDFKICRGGHNYLYFDNHNEDENIECFLNQLRKRAPYCEYLYSYTYSSPCRNVQEKMQELDLCSLEIDVVDTDCDNSDGSTHYVDINENFVPVSDKLIQSIIRFFEYLFELRDQYKRENDY